MPLLKHFEPVQTETLLTIALAMAGAQGSRQMAPTHQRELGRIETMLATAVQQLRDAQTELFRVGHDDSAEEINALVSRAQRLFDTTRERLGRPK